MGIFDLFGGKNKAEEEKLQQEKAEQEKKEKELQAVKDAHADMEWPSAPKLNPVNVKDANFDELEDTVSKERKDEIGPMIYEEELSADSLRFLSNQELLFLLTAQEVFNKKSPIPGYEKNHRKVYNELLGRIRDSKVLYALYDATTGYPFIDHGFANVYFEKDIAEKAATLFAKQFRRLLVKEILVENENDPTGQRRGFFDYLYFIGIENLFIENGAYRARFKRNEIVAAPGDWNGADQNSNTPVNPALNFAMLDFLGELRWPVNYEKRNEILRAKEMRMLALIRSANFIIPMQHEGPAEVLEDGKLKFNKDTKIRFLVMKTPDGKQFLPLFTDMIEFGKKPADELWNAAVFSYQDILKFVQDKDGIRINPHGQQIVIPKDRMMVLEAAGRQADAMKGGKKAPGVSPVNQSEEAMVQSALNQAIMKLNEKPVQQGDTEE
jgi:hypothetical protein